MKREEQDDTTDFIHPVILGESVKEAEQLERQGIVEKGTSRKLFIFICVLLFIGTIITSIFQLEKSTFVLSSTAMLNGTEW